MSTPHPDPVQPIDLLDPALYMHDPSTTFAWLRANAPVYHDRINGLFGISRHDDIVAIERNPHLWSSDEGTRPMMSAGLSTESMIDLDNPRHAEQRSIVSGDFTRRAVHDLEARVRRIVNELIDGFAAHGNADLVADLAAPLPVSIICEKLGFDRSMWHTLMEWGDAVNNLGDGVRFHTPEKMQALLDWRMYAAGVLHEKSQAPCGDLLSRITQAKLATLDGCPMSMDALLDEALLLLVGGSDTTRASITTAMWELSQRPEQWAALVADPGRLVIAVEEFVRWATPVMNMCRTATSDTVLHGVAIAKGQKVLLMYGSANRDEAIFGSAAEQFDIARFPNPHVGFGFGPHLCMGINLAKMQIRVCFEELIRRLPDIHVRPGFTPSYNDTAFVRGYTSLPVEFTPTA
jgi:cytochrome P450 family 142 subfamily A polypeptide 1